MITTPKFPIEENNMQDFGIGIDFSGGKHAARKTWLAKVTRNKASRNLKVVELRNGLTYDDIIDSLESHPTSIALLDFPFGLAKTTCENLGVTQGSIDAIWEAVARLKSADEFQIKAKANQKGKGTELPHKRKIDLLFKTPFAPINLRMYKQTYFGFTKVLHEIRRRKLAIRIAPWDLTCKEAFVPFIAEGCPASFLKAIGLPSSGYKSAEPTGRAKLLVELKQRFDLVIDDDRTNLIIEDSEGDALDALILAIGAIEIRQAEVEQSLQFLADYPTEGYVYLGVT
jgi:hypothetical protein